MASSLMTLTVQFTYPWGQSVHFKELGSGISALKLAFWMYSNIEISNEIRIHLTIPTHFVFGLWKYVYVGLRYEYYEYMYYYILYSM